MSDRSGSQEIWKTPVGEDRPQQVTRQGGYQAFESADGQTLYYAKKQSGRGVWRMPASGGPETLVSNLAWQNLWSLTPDGLYYFDLGEEVPRVFEVPDAIPVRRIDLKSNEITTVATIRTDLPRGAPALEVRSDGRYIAWVGRREHRSELMLVRNLHLSR